jgi:WD40 repeat protein
MAMDSKDAPQMIEHLRKSISFTPHETKWIPQSARFVSFGVSPSSKGVLLVNELSRGELKTVLEETELLPCGIKCATFGASRIEDRRVAVGAYDGSLNIFDLSSDKDRSPVKLFSVKAHDGLINCIDGIGGSSVGNGAPELATGGKDGNVRIWDPRVDHPVISFEPGEGSANRDCWTVSFGDSFSDADRCLAAGYDNGDVKLFDLRTNTVRWETNCRNGVTCAEFDRNDIEMNKLMVTTLESTFRCYDMRTRHRKDGFSHLKEEAHRSTIWLGRHLPQNRDIFMTGGGNGGFNIYKYHYPLNRVAKHGEDGLPIGKMGDIELLNSRIISTQPVTSFDWSPDKAGLCCMSCLDQTIR